MRSDERVRDKMRRHAMLIVNAAAVLCLLFTGRLAAASKTFGGSGGGGYGGEEGGQQHSAEATPQPLLSEGTAAAVAGQNLPLFPQTKPDAGAVTSDGAYSTPSEPAPSTSADSAATPAAPEAPTEGPPLTGRSEAQPSTADQGYAPATSDEPENGLNEKAINDIVNEHNVFRAKEHVPPLQWNATLAKFSQQYAEQLKGECKMVHSTSPYGENLMLGTGAITWKHTVDEWSAEKQSYHYGSNTCDSGKMCGHYTAVVWKGTTGVGCGRVKCNNGDTMIVCSYWPPGNYDGVRPF